MVGRELIGLKGFGLGLGWWGFALCVFGFGSHFHRSVLS